MIPIKSTPTNNNNMSVRRAVHTTIWNDHDHPIVDDDDILKAVDLTRKAHTEFVDNLKVEYVKNNSTITLSKLYYFKVIRNDNNKGIAVFVSPTNLLEYEVYTVNDSKIDKMSSIMFKNVIDIVSYYQKTIFKNEVQNIKSTVVYFHIKNKLPDNFKIYHQATNIKIIDTTTRNGYYLTFEDDNAVNMYVLYSNTIHKTHKTTYHAVSISDFEIKLNHYIKSDIHNIKIGTSHIRPLTDIFETFENIEEDASEIKIYKDDDPI